MLQILGKHSGSPLFSRLEEWWELFVYNCATDRSDRLGR